MQKKKKKVPLVYVPYSASINSTTTTLLNRSC